MNQSHSSAVSSSYRLNRKRGCFLASMALSAAAKSTSAGAEYTGLTDPSSRRASTLPAFISSASDFMAAAPSAWVSASAPVRPT